MPPPDLRAVLRLQPSNAEALAEIYALCPSEAAPSEPVASGSSSSSSVRPSSSTALPAQASTWIPAPKAPKALPFTRSVMDDRKLKISPIPVTVEIPVDLSLFAAADGVPNKTKTKTAAASTSSGKTVKETFSYPSWGRYLVKKISD